MSATAPRKAAATAPSPQRKRRPKAKNLPHSKLLRLGDAEMAAVEATRQALTIVRGSNATFCEAVRMLITDKVEVADVEARAQAIADGTIPSGPVEVPAELATQLTDLHRYLAHSQGSLNSVSKNLAFANKALNFSLTQTQLDEALAEVRSIRDFVVDVEHQVRGLPAAKRL